MKCFFAIVTSFFIVASVFAQQSEKKLSLFLSVRPDVIITVLKHDSGADVFDVLVNRADYPASLLEKQLNAIGTYLGTDIRGLRITVEQLSPDQPNLKALKAMFAAQGIIDREKGTYNIEPIVKAFAGAPDPYTIKGMTIFFQNEKATDRTIKNYSSSSVEAEAFFTDQSPAGIEYRIHLLTQDPEKITFPREHVKPLTPIEGEAKNRTPLIITLFVLASLALGVLVYLAVLRGASQPSSRKPKK